VVAFAGVSIARKLEHLLSIAAGAAATVVHHAPGLPKRRGSAFQPDFCQI